MTNILLRREDTQTTREGGHVNMEAEKGVSPPQAEGQQRCPGDTRS